jgi:DNA-binding response OmpR family regulator
MSTSQLRDLRILVVEDEYWLADELCTELTEAGAIVIGPAASVADALALIESADHLDGAVLDVNLRGVMGFPVADLLAQRGVRFVFATGYDDDAIPSRFSGTTRYQKPVAIRQIERALGNAPRSG